MKIRWIAETRVLGYNQQEVSSGDVLDLPDDIAASFVEQELAEKVATTTKPKEND